MNLNLNNIQGNILGGFNKDFQTFVLLRFTDARKGRAWIDRIASQISSSSMVLRFNRLFKALRASGVKEPAKVISATWTNLAISHRGMVALGIAADTFPQEFRRGMAAQGREIGDLGASAPQTWQAPFNSREIHAILLVASDSESSLKKRVREIRNDPTFRAGARVIRPILEGRTRKDMRGHEHFGFKDGISQPGIRGIDRPDARINQARGNPGPPLLWPGEFVLGYPRQRRGAKKGKKGPNPDPGPISRSGPAWTVDGSFLVFRRLHQDVAGFRRNLKKLAASLNMSEALVGAKLVGRYKSGCPIEARAFHGGGPFVPPNQDPGKKSALARSNAMNNFGFRDDPQGNICPIAAHIRKAYPRDSRADIPAKSETHRLLRRGIPFGKSFGARSGGRARDRRGLLFLAYQNDIGEHFEFVQKNWVNNRDFPNADHPGQDAIVAQSARGPFMLNGRHLSIHHFVQTTGGEYFFAPSISALRKIGSKGIA
jgi:Dyp-type peroxidase family